MKTSFAALIALFSITLTGQARAATIETCAMDYSGAINAVYVNGGRVTGIAKIFASSSTDEAFTLIAENGIEHTRHGTITTTLDLTDFALNGTCQFENRFTPLHSIDEDSPWRQFQMHRASIYDSTMLAKYDHNGVQADLLIANGWTWGDDLSSIHVFEMVNGKFNPVKYDIDTGNGQLPPYKAGNRTMSVSGDGGQWRYRASAVSADGRLIVGYAKLDETVTFNSGVKIKSSDKFGMMWQITESCAVNRGKCNNQNASRLTSGSSKTGSIAVQSISDTQLQRDSSDKASNSELPQFDNITYDKASLLEDVYSVTDLGNNKYLINGRSASGKAMIVRVTL
ncbi:hypothetical protein [Planctobacterium marinum]|uniref:hypothetical protein n=1 Tax=Planctobacterium marinum TaxID=1631968 RepID=UPI001E38E109|nr:hypothetical protein [Planctobacterium marinum]MCC2603931.1 hypothetical protein [Planctobacterium marinum]